MSAHVIEASLVTLRRSAPDIAVLVETLQAQMPADLYRLVTGVVESAFEAGHEHGYADCAAEMEDTLAHFPGIRPAWDVVRSHVRPGLAPECVTVLVPPTAEFAQCRLCEGDEEPAEPAR